MMMRFLFCFLAFFFLSCESRSLSPPEKSEPFPVPKVTVEREKVEKGDPLPPEVKIRLRRDEKGHTSWELSGSDADQILKVNDRLKKGLSGDSAR